MDLQYLSFGDRRSAGITGTMFRAAKYPFNPYQSCWDLLFSPNEEVIKRSLMIYIYILEKSLW